MRLGQALCRLAAVHPHFFNSFYRRVRVVREPPRPMPAAVTVDVTHVCSLRCPFCIAAGVLGDREMTVETFTLLAEELAGIGRLTLIGGEPFQHRSLGELCRLARTAATEVEVFTNGLVLGTSPSGAGDKLGERIAGASTEWLTLVLSVDPDHASRMPEGRLELAVQGLLAAERAGVCRARFSVTHAALRTGSYLDTNTLTQAIEEVSPSLARLFPERLMEGRIQDTFYFNSVICGGGGGEVDGEQVRLEDLVFSPEVAISFDSKGLQRNDLRGTEVGDAPWPQGAGEHVDRRRARRHVEGDGGPATQRTGMQRRPNAASCFAAGPKGEPVVFSSLAAMWAEVPAPGCVVGTTPPHATQRLLHRAGLGEPEGPTPGAWADAWKLVSGLGDTGARDRLLRARLPLARFLTWDGGAQVVQQRADALFAMMASGIGSRAVQCGGDEGGDGLDTAVLAALLSRMSQRPEWRSSLAHSLARTVTSLLFDADGRALRPVYAGERELLGMRVPLAPGEEHPLDRVHLPGEEGFGPRDELVVRPRLIVLSDAEARLDFPGISGQTTGRAPSRGEREAAVKRVLGMATALAGPDLARDACSLLPQPLRKAAAGLSEGTPSRLGLLPEDDPMAAFLASTFDRNRQRGDEDNPELLALLLAQGATRFPERAWKKFVSAVLTWLERLQVPPGPTALMLLGDLALKGEPGRRLRRLLETRKRNSHGGVS